jgi:hypothetical protein
MPVLLTDFYSVIDRRKMSIAYKTLFGKYDGNRPLGKHRQNDNIRKES